LIPEPHHWRDIVARFQQARTNAARAP